MSVNARPYRKARATNSTATTFTAASFIPTVTKGTTWIDLLDPAYGAGGGHVPDWLEFMPYGTDGSNDTFNMQIWGWSQTSDATPVYIPQLLALVAVVLGNIDAAAIAAGNFLADTLTVTKGPADNAEWGSVISPANDTVATLILHTRGCQWLDFDWDLAGAQEGVSMNCLWRPMDQR